MKDGEGWASRAQMSYRILWDENIKVGLVHHASFPFVRKVSNSAKPWNRGREGLGMQRPQL